VEEAENRGLFNLVSTPEALEQLTSEKNKKLLLDHKIFTEQELYSRYEILLDNYMKTVSLEANTMVEMIQKDLLPAIVSYTEQLARTASLKKSVIEDVSLVSEVALIKKLSQAQTDLYNGIEKLKADNAAAKKIDDHLEAAKFYQSVVLKCMADIRVFADEAEAVMPESMLPYPTYGQLLFSI
ncbi:MAG: glutamine synthetase type III, partial [Lachnospiraceae bacterium]|nr:glutamine synthetase type III [Lachnospiraceae bacterium]